MKVLGALVGVVGVILAIVFLFVGGIESIISGFSASPDNVSDIVWGFVRVFCTWAGIWAAIAIGGVIAVLGE